MIFAATLSLAFATGRPGACHVEPVAGMLVRSTVFGEVMASRSSDLDYGEVAGMVAGAAARRFLAVDMPSLLVTEAGELAAVDRAKCAIVFAWRFPKDVDGKPIPSHVLPHEIGHAVFMRMLVKPSEREEYGGAAPDWLDEMAALAFEDAGGVTSRRADGRRHAARGALIPLRRLLAMPHPEWHPADTSVAPVVSQTAVQPSSSDTPAFYATVRVLFDFLVARTHDEQVIRRLADAVNAGTDLQEWIVARLRPADAIGLTDLDAQLLTFALTDEAYGDPTG